VSVGLQLPEPGRIAIVMLSALGDAVNVLPVVNALKRHWPGSEITWIIQPVPYRLVQGHAAVNRFLLFQRRRGVRGLSSFLELRRRANGLTFDLVLNLQVYLKAGVITGMLDCPVKLGFDRKRARDMNWAFTTHRIPPHPVQHVQDQYFEFLAHLGVEPHPVTWRLELTEEERSAQQRWLERLERPPCAVVVGTSRPAKNWAADRCASLLEHVYGDYRLQPVLVGGPSPLEQELAQTVVRLARVPVRNELSDDIRRLLWLLEASALVISPDTGPLHAARALDRPVVGLYGYTNPKRSGPYGRPEAVVDGYARFQGEPYEASMEYRPDGMERVTVARALEVMERVLQKASPPRAPGAQTVLPGTAGSPPGPAGQQPAGQQAARPGAG